MPSEKKEINLTTPTKGESEERGVILFDEKAVNTAIEFFRKAVDEDSLGMLSRITNDCKLDNKNDYWKKNIFGQDPSLQPISLEASEEVVHVLNSHESLSAFNKKGDFAQWLKKTIEKNNDGVGNQANAIKRFLEWLTSEALAIVHDEKNDSTFLNSTPSPQMFTLSKDDNNNRVYLEELLKKYPPKQILSPLHSSLLVAIALGATPLAAEKDTEKELKGGVCEDQKQYGHTLMLIGRLINNQSKLMTNFIEQLVTLEKLVEKEEKEEKAFWLKDFLNEIRNVYQQSLKNNYQDFAFYTHLIILAKITTIDQDDYFKELFNKHRAFFCSSEEPTTEEQFTLFHIAETISRLISFKKHEDVYLTVKALLKAIDKNKASENKGETKSIDQNISEIHPEKYKMLYETLKAVDEFIKTPETDSLIKAKKAILDAYKKYPQYPWESLFKAIEPSPFYDFSNKQAHPYRLTQYDLLQTGKEAWQKYGSISEIKVSDTKQPNTLPLHVNLYFEGQLLPPVNENHLSDRVGEENVKLLIKHGLFISNILEPFFPASKVSFQNIYRVDTNLYLKVSYHHLCYKHPQPDFKEEINAKTEAIFKFTEHGFQLIELSTDSPIVHDILKDWFQKQDPEKWTWLQRNTRIFAPILKDSYVEQLGQRFRRVFHTTFNDNNSHRKDREAFFGFRDTDNPYNWLEFFVRPFTWVKNTVKLFAEYLPQCLGEMAYFIFDNTKRVFGDDDKIAKGLAVVGSFLACIFLLPFTLVSQAAKQILSPFRAMRDANAFGNAIGGKWCGRIFGALSMVTSIGLISGLLVTVLPVAAPFLAAAFPALYTSINAVTGAAASWISAHLLSWGAAATATTLAASNILTAASVVAPITAARAALKAAGAQYAQNSRAKKTQSNISRIRNQEEKTSSSTQNTASITNTFRTSTSSSPEIKKQEESHFPDSPLIHHAETKTTSFSDDNSSRHEDSGSTYYTSRRSSLDASRDSQRSKAEHSKPPSPREPSARFQLPETPVPTTTRIAPSGNYYAMNEDSSPTDDVSEYSLLGHSLDSRHSDAKHSKSPSPRNKTDDFSQEETYERIATRTRSSDHNPSRNENSGSIYANGRNFSPSVRSIRHFQPPSPENKPARFSREEPLSTPITAENPKSPNKNN